MLKSKLNGVGPALIIGKDGELVAAEDPKLKGNK